MAEGLTLRETVLKRGVDLAVATVGLVVGTPLIGLGWLAATLSTRQNGLFRQTRIGRYGRPFEILKLRTMRSDRGVTTTVTVRDDVRITRIGSILRQLKIDELPQLANVLRGEMSLVGPRPDVPGFADRLTGEDRVILSVRPGITGPAAVAYRHEEQILGAVDDPERFNREVIWPAKVRINRDYIRSWTFRADLKCLRDTVFAVASPHTAEFFPAAHPIPHRTGQ